MLPPMATADTPADAAAAGAPGLFSAALPADQGLADHRASISGEWRPGELIPSEIELASRFQRQPGHGAQGGRRAGRREPAGPAPGQGHLRRLPRTRQRRNSASCASRRTRGAERRRRAAFSTAAGCGPRRDIARQLELRCRRCRRLSATRVDASADDRSCSRRSGCPARCSRD